MISNKSKNKYILAIDTTSKIAGVALANNKKILAESNIDNGLTHSVTLFDSIYKVLRNTKVTMKDIYKICVANGPGSFTGIRIGIAAALGLAKPYNIKISYVDSLKSLAYNVKDEAEYIVSMIDAKVNRIYISIYKNSLASQILNDMIIDIETLCKYFNKYFSKSKTSFIFVGDGAKAYEDYFKNNLKINYKLANNKDIYQKASSLIYIDGISSKMPNINYMLASKAEREQKKCKK